MLASEPRGNPLLLILECGMAVMAALVAFGWPGIADGFFRPIESLFTRLARRRVLAVLVVGASAGFLRLILLPLFPIPLPFVPDDFSFLLAADTFAHGRLTNPTPAMWTHFETVHETMRPTYQSMYFPGQGLLLAAGQVLFGHPWFALLATVVLMCAAITWMLQGWLPPKWALLGGFIAVLRLGIFNAWINTYFTAGALSALGGALVLGALPRLKRTARLQYGLVMAIGIAILGLTRPYEGLLLCIPVAVALGLWAWKGANRPPAIVLVRRAALPLAVVVAAGGWLGYYDHVAFGKASTLPYTVDRATYGATPYYIWQGLPPAPHYRYASLRAFYREGGDMEFYRMARSFRTFLPYTLQRIEFVVIFYAGFILIWPVVIGWRAFRDRRTRFLIVSLIVLTVGVSIEIYVLPYYLAPFTSLFYAIGLQGMRHLRLWKPEGRPVGLTMVRLTLVSCVALAGLRAFAGPLHLEPSRFSNTWLITWLGPTHLGEERAQVEHQLEQLPGGQLAIVRYSAHHPTLDQWVYNSADIDHAKIVWAEDMSPSENKELLQYYRDRTAWLITPDDKPARITPYTSQNTVATR